MNNGKNNGMWKGDKVGYGALYDWVRCHKPKPEVCEMCKIAPPLDLANISGQYKRDINDFQWLCRKCHMISDGRTSNEVKCPYCYNAFFISYFNDEQYWTCLWCQCAFPITIPKKELCRIRTNYLQNSSERLKQKKQYYQKNKQKILKHNKQYHETHKEKMKEYHKQYQRQYRKEHKEKLNKYQREYRRRRKQCNQQQLSK